MFIVGNVTLTAAQVRNLQFGVYFLDVVSPCTQLVYSQTSVRAQFARGVLKQFVEDLSEKANNLVLNLDTHSDGDDENKCEIDDNDDNSVEEDDDADHASYSGETEHGYIESLIAESLRWKRPSLSNVAFQ